MKPLGCTATKDVSPKTFFGVDVPPHNRAAVRAVDFDVVHRTDDWRTLVLRRIMAQFITDVLNSIAPRPGRQVYQEFDRNYKVFNAG